ncbi:DUF502 domain-containing protein [Paracoccus broussonetiae]|uniref:DUF502 domain-containing protein n=1 Tax=Paracoccus broussonetiae subsp. drimophilus TaxID=3373869 RepID=A0ABW7LQ08_9RHOB
MKPGGSSGLHAVVGFIRATIIGGLVFLLPFGIILMVVERLYAAAKPLGRGIHDTMFPGSPSHIWPVVFAVLILLSVAFVSGIFARSAPGRRMFHWLEGAFLTRLPPYTILRQMIEDFSESGQSLSVGEANTVVLVRFDDYSCTAFLIERRPNREVVVFLPGAPSATSGSVAIVSADRIQETDLTPIEVMRSMRRLGLGLNIR